MKEKSLIGLKLISFFQFFGVIALLRWFNVEQTPAFNVYLGVPFLPELLVKVLCLIIGGLIAYGYLMQAKWGFWSMLIYSFLLGIISLQEQTQLLLGNAVYWFVVWGYTLIHFKDFDVTFYLNKKKR